MKNLSWWKGQSGASKAPCQDSDGQHVAGWSRRKAGGRAQFSGLWQELGWETASGGAAPLLSGVRVWCWLPSGHMLRKFGSVKCDWVHIVHDWVTVGTPFCQSNLREKEEF